MADETTPTAVSTTKTVRTGKGRTRVPIIQVDVVVNLPPITMPAMNINLPPAPDYPPPPAPSPAPAPVDDGGDNDLSQPIMDPQPNTPWYYPGHLWWFIQYAVHWQAYQFDHFYKKWHFWMWTALLSLPSLYDMAVSQHYIDSTMVPPLLTKIISSIAFFGAASQMVKKKGSASPMIARKRT